jgi:hypothetical protein
MPITITIPTLTLTGWKTYLCAAGLIAATIAQAYGYLTTEQYLLAMGLLNGGGVAALRSGVKKSGPQEVLTVLERVLGSTTSVADTLKGEPKS